MDFHPLTTFCRVRKVCKNTGKFLSTRYTKMTDKYGNTPNTEDVHRIKYAHKETENSVFIVSECSEAEYNAKTALPAAKRETKWLLEDLYEEFRLAQYSADYSALCGLAESIPRKALVDFFAD